MYVCFYDVLDLPVNSFLVKTDKTSSSQFLFIYEITVNEIEGSVNCPHLNFQF